jgi:hypothetical protein
LSGVFAREGGILLPMNVSKHAKTLEKWACDAHFKLKNG